MLIQVIKAKTYTPYNVLHAPNMAGVLQAGAHRSLAEVVLEEAQVDEYIGIARWGTSLFGYVWYDVVLYYMVRYGAVWYDMVWFGLVWYCMVWYGVGWYGMVLYGMV